MDTPYPNTIILCIMHFFITFVSRMWDMGILLLLADVSHNNMLLISVTGFLSSLSVFLLASWCGKLIDSSNRLSSITYVIVAKVMAISISYSLIALDLSLNDSKDYNLVYAVPVFSSIAGLSFRMLNVCMEKDWIIVLSNSNSSWLSSMNAIFSQIDMFCMAFAPVLTCWLFDAMKPRLVAVLLMLLNGGTSLGFYLFIRQIYFSFPPLWHRNVLHEDRSNQNSEDIELTVSESTPLFQSSNRPHDMNRHNNLIVHYLQCLGCMFPELVSHSGDALGVMIAYAFLYMTVLSFGPLLTVYLIWAGLSLEWVGLLR